MPDGTIATYQGIGLTRCTFQRTRGYGSTGTVVELHLDPGFTLEPFKLEDLFRSALATAPVALGPSAVRARKKLSAYGHLVMKETVRDVVHEHPPVLLFVVRAEEVRRSDGSPTGRFRLSLEDVRYFFARGLLKRWSYNRHRADGTVALDSVKPNGDRYTKGEVAQAAARALPGAPKLAAYPSRWDQDQSSQDFPRFGGAAAALARLSAKAGLEDLCLRLDGDVALHTAGDGLLGYAPGGKGANSQPFPKEVVLSKNGQGRGKTLEPGYPEEFILVAGGERVVTVAVDDWEPVLQFPGGLVRKLDEALMRNLTNGKFGLDWLSRFVLQPTAYQHHPDVDSDVAELLADQAWQLYRLPGVEVESAAASPAHGQSSSLFNQAAELAQERADADVKVTGPGPNAHLLPILPRAETVHGRRQAPLVEAYSFTTEHVKLRGSPGQQALEAVRREIARLRANVPTTSNVPLQPRGGAAELQAGDVFRGAEDRLAARGVRIADIDAALRRVREIESFRSKSSAGPGFADQLMKLTREQIQAEEQVGAEGGRTEIFDAAVAIFETEKQIREDAAAGILPDADTTIFGTFTSEGLRDALFRREASRQALISRIEPLLVRAEREREERRKRIETTGSPGAGEDFGLVVLSNRPVAKQSVEVRGPDLTGLEGDARSEAIATGGTPVSTPLPTPRAVDGAARVVDAEAGLVRLSGLGGHVAPDGASDPSHAHFVPRAVRVTFGVKLRPRVDKPPPFDGFEVTVEAVQDVIVEETGDAVSAELQRLHAQNEAAGVTLRQAIERDRSALIAVQPGGGQSVISDALSDQESWYAAAFRRTGRGEVEQVQVDTVPLDRAVRVEEPDFVELVKLDGTSNRADLDAAAHRIAQERANVPDVVESMRVVLARPWPVQCDGVVSSVTITLREKDGVPCGFETVVTTGTTGTPPIGERRTQVRPSSPNDARGARREGMS